MRIGVVPSPVGAWQDVVEAARIADGAGFDAVGLWGHYHSARPEWEYVSALSAYGALAELTSNVRLVPMVLNPLHYQLGVLAKETAQLAIASRGRFELGIGGGDWPAAFAAWGIPFPGPVERLGLLTETLDALLELWTGRPVTRNGRHLHLADACVTPAPAKRPRIVVGVGSSIATARATVGLADELNVYADEQIVDAVRQMAGAAGRPVDVSLFVSWEWDKWPPDPLAELAAWRDRGIDRVFVSLGASNMAARLRQLEPMLG